MQWSDDLKIETPEQIDVALELAGLGSRFVAQLLDWLLKALLLLGVGVLVLIAAALLAQGSLGDETATYVLVGLGVGLSYAVVLGYDIFYEVRWSGQTPGKRSAGIRVVREGGGPLDVRAACVRNLLALADFLPSFYLLGALLIVLTRRGQRLGDLAAGTVVVRERALEPPSELDDTLGQLASAEFTFTAAQLAACGPNGRQILRSFFQRYHGMEPHIGSHLAGRLAAEFVRKTDWQALTPVDDGPRAVAFLASLYRDLEHQARLRG